MEMCNGITHLAAGPHKKRLINEIIIIFVSPNFIISRSILFGYVEVVGCNTLLQFPIRRNDFMDRCCNRWLEFLVVRHFGLVNTVADAQKVHSAYTASNGKKSLGQKRGQICEKRFFSTISTSNISIECANTHTDTHIVLHDRRLRFIDRIRRKYASACARSRLCAHLTRSNLVDRSHTMQLFH